MRGKLSSLPALLLALGVLLGYVLGNNVDNRASNEGYPKVPKDFTITIVGPFGNLRITFVSSSS